MAGRKLAVFVHVADDNGQAHVFGPADNIPAWARKKITNPDVWDDGKDDDEPVGVEDPGNSGPTSE